MGRDLSGRPDLVVSTSDLVSEQAEGLGGWGALGQVAEWLDYDNESQDCGGWTWL